ncbi:MAG: hypothetical protein KAG66_07490, partial [Methylococcales bacterium]|nr:hypothetical protein [Methylococcales bacterium]
STAQESKAAEIEGVLAEKDRLLQEKETELSDLHQKLSEDTAAQESKVTDFEGVIAEKDRLIQVRDAELADLQQRLSVAGTAAERSSDGQQTADSAVEGEVESPSVDAIESELIAETQGNGDAEQATNEAELDTEASAEPGVGEDAGTPEDSEVAQEPIIDGPSDIAQTEPVVGEPQEQVTEDSSASNPNLLLGAGVGGLLLAGLGLLAFRKKSSKEAPVVGNDVIGDDVVDATTTVKTIVSEDDNKQLYSDGGHEEVVEKYVEEDVISDATMVVETQPEPFLESFTHTEKNIVDVDESSISVEDEADIVAAMTAELAAGDLDLDLDDDLSSVDGMDGIEDEVLS